MCGFCVEHGEGRRWYLQAETYAHDLANDVRRRDYLVRFVRDFERNRKRALAGAGLLSRLPDPLRRVGRAASVRSMRRNHFGQPVPLEELDSVLDMTTSVVRLPCVCRSAAGTPDDAFCLAITTRPIDGVLADAFADFQGGPDVGAFERLSKDEAMRLMRDLEAEGCMHSVWTFQTPFIGAVCNCSLASGCMAMRLTVEHDVPIMWRGESVAVLDPELCSGCGACAARCPFDAIERGRPAAVRTAGCWGCGVCRSACRSGAIELRDRRHVPAAAGVW